MLKVSKLAGRLDFEGQKGRLSSVAAQNFILITLEALFCLSMENQKGLFGDLSGLLGEQAPTRWV